LVCGLTCGYPAKTRSARTAIEMRKVIGTPHDSWFE
jgi:hypothetical protein